MTKLRIAFAIVGCVGALFLPPYIPALCILILAALWRSWEAIVLAFFLDMLWLTPLSGFHGLPLITLCTIVLVWAFEPIRQQLLPA